MNDNESKVEDLMQVPGVGKSVAMDLLKIGITTVHDLRGKDPETLYELINRKEGDTQDRCLLYVFRCAVYYASTKKSAQHPEKLKWWNWTDTRMANNMVEHEI
ncbi:MAG: helix-hairpin-helix domain-containing protein [Candidatus Kryptoniota bacterium]